MKLPNFRLYSIQATTSMLLGLFGMLCAVVLAFFVFKGLNAEQMVIPYDPAGPRGQYRKPLIFGTTAVMVLLGGVAGLMGFNSLGQRRNDKQGRSWLGLTLGALAMSLAPILLCAWVTLSEVVLRDIGG